MLRKYARTRLALCVCLCALTAPAQSPTQTIDLDAYVREQISRRKIPGLALAVIRNGEIIKLNGYGVANVELNAPVTPDTIFQSGSVGKQFTAAAILLLAEAGRLKLDEPVSRYFEQTPPSWQSLTIRHLLTHTGGIRNLAPPELNYQLDYSDEELLQKALAAPLDFVPGSQWRYSNTGYVLLGLLIKKATGQFYGDVLRERIFAPLKMETARVISEADIVPQRAAGYRLDRQRQLKNQTYVAPTLNQTADGALYLTIRDLAKWAQALESGSLLKATSLAQWWTPVSLSDGATYPYGFGWFFDETRGHRVIEHSGGWQGFAAHIARYPDDKLTIAVLTNLNVADPSGIAHGLAELLVPELERRPIELAPAVLDAYAGQYELAPGVVFTVSRAQDKLVLQVTGQPALALLAESETKFFVRIVDAQFSFVRHAAGTVTHLRLHQSGAQLDAKKIK